MQIFSIGFCADLPRLQILFVNLHFTGFQKQQWHHPWLAFAVVLQVVALAAIKAGLIKKWTAWVSWKQMKQMNRAGCPSPFLWHLKCSKSKQPLAFLLGYKMLHVYRTDDFKLLTFWESQKIGFQHKSWLRWVHKPLQDFLYIKKMAIVESWTSSQICRLCRSTLPAKQPKVIPMSLPAKVVNLATCILSCARAIAWDGLRNYTPEI